MIPIFMIIEPDHILKGTRKARRAGGRKGTQCSGKQHKDGAYLRNRADFALGGSGGT